MVDTRSRRTRSVLRIFVYLALAAVFYLLAPIAAGSAAVSVVLAATILFGAFWEFLFWRELLFGHPERGSSS